MPGVIDLTDVLELIIEHFNQSSLPQEDLVDQAYQPRFHVFTEPDDQLDSLESTGVRRFCCCGSYDLQRSPFRLAGLSRDGQHRLE